MAPAFESPASFVPLAAMLTNHSGNVMGDPITTHNISPADVG